MGTTADDMIDMLRRHYLPESRPPGGIFAPEIGSPDGRRRADLIWMPVTISGGRGLHGHEVKVSRSDVLAELADPTKAEPWAQYCSRWWLVVSDPALIDGLDVPESWGVMAPPSGRRRRSMTILRPAPELHPKEPAPGVARLASWLFHKTNDRHREEQHNLASARRRAEHAEQRAREAQASGGQAHPVARRIAGIIHAAEKRVKDELFWAEVDDTDVVDALVDVTAVRATAERAKRDLQTLVRNVENITEPFKYTKRDLDRLMKETA